VNDVWRKKGEWNGQTFVPLADYQTNLKKLCERARAGGVRDIVLVSPTTIDHEATSELNVLLGTYADWVRTYAADINATYVDARSPLLAARAARPQITWTGDGCHPTASGHALIAAAWFDAVVGRGSH
jgi:lysophospholipase L1-like esterase